MSEKNYLRPIFYCGTEQSSAIGKVSQSSRFSTFVKDPRRHSLDDDDRVNQEVQFSVGDPEVVVLSETDRDGVFDRSPMLERNVNRRRVDSENSLFQGSQYGDLNTWIESEEARGSMVALLSGLYALILVILAFAFEVSLVVSGNVTSSFYMPFYIYLYLMALFFFLYCYFFLLRTKGYRCCKRAKFSEFFLRGTLSFASSTASTHDDLPQNFRQSSADVLSKKRKVTYSGAAAGSMYLRLGAVVFGIVGMVHNGLGIASHIDDPQCSDNIKVATLVLSAIFTFVQLYFIFMNSKLTIHRFKDIGRFGAMHLVATNICVWIQGVVREEYEVIHEIAEKNGAHLKSGDASHTVNHTNILQVPEIRMLVADFTLGCNEYRSSTESFVADMKPFMSTCIIEYSILCAAVMYILWRNIGLRPSQCVKQRKQAIRVDCSSSTKGLFSGLLFVTLTVISMIIFYIKVHRQQDRYALWVFYLSDSVLYLVSTIASVVGIYRMRTLMYIPTKENVVLLDDILLLVSLFGQLTYCLFSMTAVVEDSLVGYLSIVVNLLRVVQILLQTMFILAAQRLVAVTPDSLMNKPGRETVTFLLLVNISLWLLNTFETQKTSSNSVMISFYAKSGWTNLVHSTVPLCIFYRFHSSVCFAEIWKNTYKTK